MTDVVRHSNSCKVVAVASRVAIDGVVMEFREHKNLMVVLNKSVKLSMTWNGRCYEGRNAGMDFESAGPSVSKSQTALRG